MTSSLLQPAGSLGFPNLGGGATPPIMAPGQMPTNTGIVPPAPAPAAAPGAVPGAAPDPRVKPVHTPGEHGQHMREPHQGFLERLQQRLGGGGDLAGQHMPPLLSALFARFGHPPAAPAAAPAPAPGAASIMAPTGVVPNQPANVIY